MKHVIRNLANEVILLLGKEDLHARALADLLNANHITLGRKLMDLQKEVLPARAGWCPV